MIGNYILRPDGGLRHCARDQAYAREICLFAQSVQRGRRLRQAEELRSKPLGDLVKLPLSLLQFLLAILKVASVPLLFFSITLSLPLMLFQRPTVTHDASDDFASTGEITYDQIAAGAGDSSTPPPRVPPLPATNPKVTAPSVINIGTLRVGP